jgi:diguanylate cyclase (GGDEF)-like protein
MGKNSYLYEVPIFYGIVFLVQKFFFPQHPSFFEITPHPYWLGILPFALRYGLLAGFLSGLFSCGFYLTGLWMEGDRYLFEDAEFYILPFIFILVGFIVGEVIDRLHSLLDKKEADRQQVIQDKKALATQITLLKKTNQALEKQVVSQVGSLVVLYEGASRLENLEREQLMKNILSFFTQALQANKASLYLKEENSWVLDSEVGWTPQDPYSKRLDFREGLIGKAGSENKIVSLRDWFPQDLGKAWQGRNRADAIFAGPIRRAPKEVIGVYAVQDLPFLKFTSATLNLLALLLNWAEISIAKSLSFEELKSKSILDEILNVYNVQYFRTRMKQEFSRSRTYSLPFCLILVRIPGLKALPLSIQINLLKALSRVLMQQSREIDIVTKYSDPEIPFAILMITASRNHAQALKEKILKMVDELGLLKPPAALSKEALDLKLGISSFHPRMGSAEVMIEEALQAER